MKHFLKTALFIASLILPLQVFAAPTVNAYLFYGDGCPHCASERNFLKTLEREDLNLYEFEVYRDQKNASLMQEIAQTLKTDAGGVPFLIIGDTPFIGFAPGITDKEIKGKINECLRETCPDSVALIVGIETDTQVNTKAPIQSPSEPEKDKIINLPFLGDIDVYDFSLPILAIVMGTLDGFNPCAMWVLLFLVSLLLGMTDKKKMWILGLAFITSSALVYFIFMAAWLNLILFLGFVIWVRILIGLLALGGGTYSIKEFIWNKESGCKVAGDEERQKVFEKLKTAINQKNFFLALGGIIALAFMVNLVELLCSAGLPAVFTQVLTLNNLASWQYYSYILLYIFFFMLDDLLVFSIAMMTLEMTGITTKYTRYSRLAGGIIMLFVGLSLLFKPDWLMF